MRRATPLGTLTSAVALLLALQPQAAHAASVDALANPAIAAWTGLPLTPELWVAPTNRIDGLTVDEQDDGTTTLRLVGSAKPTFNVYRMSDPDRLVVDIAASERGKVVPHLPLDVWACGRLAIDDVEEQDARLVRLVVLKRDASYIVTPDDDTLVVTITPRQVPPEAYFARKSASARRAEIEAAEKAAARLRDDAARRSADADSKVKLAARDARR
ncbi:MAG: AMIN domain-containing protein [Nannocystaceae bacterium]